jgi:hypothetical protein
MERYLGRYLEYYGTGHPDNEVVHHINHNRMDNRIQNLQLMTNREHTRLHSNENKVRWSKPVMRMDTNQIYPSATEAAKAVGLSASSIQIAAKNKSKAKGVFWEYVKKN